MITQRQSASIKVQKSVETMSVETMPVETMDGIAEEQHYRSSVRVLRTRCYRL